MLVELFRHKVEKCLEDLFKIYGKCQLPIPPVLFASICELRLLKNKPDRPIPPEQLIPICDWVKSWWPAVEPLLAQNVTDNDQGATSVDVTSEVKSVGDAMSELCQQILSDNGSIVTGWPTLDVFHNYLSPSSQLHLWRGLQLFAQHPKSSELVGSKFIMHDFIVGGWNTRNVLSLKSWPIQMYIEVLHKHMCKEQMKTIMDHLVSIGETVLLMQMSHRFLPGVDSITTKTINLLKSKLTSQDPKQQTAIESEDDMFSLVLETLTGDQNIVSETKKLFEGATQEDQDLALQPLKRIYAAKTKRNGKKKKKKSKNKNNSESSEINNEHVAEHSSHAQNVYSVFEKLKSIVNENEPQG